MQSESKPLVNTKGEVMKMPEPEAASSLIQVIERAATNPNVDIDKMERLLEMQERIMARDAEAEFNAAMADVQGELRPVIHDAKNDQTRSHYATLEAVAKATKPILVKHGFALSFGTADCPVQDHYRITCDLTHSGGHSKHYFADIPADLTGLKGTPNKTKTHAFGSTMSYGRRYLTLLIFDIATEDDDGNSAEPPAARQDQFLRGERIKSWKELNTALETELSQCGSLVRLEQIKEWYRVEYSGRISEERNAGVQEMFGQAEKDLMDAIEAREAGITDKAGNEMHPLEAV